MYPAPIRVKFPAAILPTLCRTFILLALLAATATATLLKEAALIPQWEPQAQFAGYYVALAKGFYAEAGVPMRILRGLFLAIMEDAVYRIAAVPLAPGTKLVAFTDGVTKAMDAKQPLFGTARLEKVLVAAAAGGPGAVDDAIFTAVRNFAGQAEQADDITVLPLLYQNAQTN